MLFLYNLLTYASILLLNIISLFNKKINLFVKGRRQSFALIKQEFRPEDQVYWFHVASLGEYEQGLPLMIALKEKEPSCKILLSFFSPSGYEVKKNNAIADLTIYLPMDTKANAKKLLSIVDVKQAFFVKYEFWPNYLNQLKKNNIPVYLVSGIFRQQQVFFKWYGGFYRKALDCITTFFVQNNTSLQLLATLGYTNTILAGDTRFDRVAEILKQNNHLDFLQDFTQNKTCTTIVIGSSWPADEHMLAQFINNNNNPQLKFIFAPHNIKTQQIQQLTNALSVPYVLHSEGNTKNLKQTNVYIIDSIGLLTKAYSYADIAYIGGGFTHGIHNILEAATFGIPIVIGPKYKKFQEAIDLIQSGSCLVVHDQKALTQTLSTLVEDQLLREKLGKIAQDFILENKEATKIIINNI